MALVRSGSVSVGMVGCWSGYVRFGSVSSGIVPVEHGLVHFGAGIGWHSTVSVSDGIVM